MIKSDHFYDCRRRENAARSKEMGDFPGEEHLLLRWQDRNGPTGDNLFSFDLTNFILIQAGIFYVTLLLVIGTSGLFFAFDCPFLTERISPVIPVVGAVLFIFVLSNLLKTSFSDPGIIPRATNAEAENIEREIEQPNGAGQAYRPPPRTKEIQVIQKVYDKEKFWSFVENFPKRQKLLKHSSLNWPNLVFLYHSLPAILNFRDLLRTVLQKLKCFAQCWTF